MGLRMYADGPEDKPRRTSVISTVGPKVNRTKTIIKLCAPDLDVVRMNFSRGGHESHKSVIDEARANGRAYEVSDDQDEAEFRRFMEIRIARRKLLEKAREEGDRQVREAANKPRLLDVLNNEVPISVWLPPDECDRFITLVETEVDKDSIVSVSAKSLHIDSQVARVPYAARGERPSQSGREQEDTNASPKLPAFADLWNLFRTPMERESVADVDYPLIPFKRRDGAPRRIFLNSFSAAGGNTALLLEDAPRSLSASRTRRDSLAGDKTFFSNTTATPRHTRDDAPHAQLTSPMSQAFSGYRSYVSRIRLECSIEWDRNNHQGDSSTHLRPRRLHSATESYLNMAPPAYSETIRRLLDSLFASAKPHIDPSEDLSEPAWVADFRDSGFWNSANDSCDTTVENQHSIHSCGSHVSNPKTSCPAGEVGIPTLRSLQTQDLCLGKSSSSLMRHARNDHDASRNSQPPEKLSGVESFLRRFLSSTAGLGLPKMFRVLSSHLH